MASNTPDETLSAKTLDAIRDVTPDDALSVEKFDIAAFVAGAKPTRRAVTLYARGDLRASLDRYGEEIALAEKEGDRKRAETLRKEARQVSEEMTAPGAVVDVIVEGRSDDWVDTLNEALEKDGVTDETEKVLRRVAEQIVEPQGFTYELLEQFRQVSEPQVKRLVAAATMANRQPVDVSADFLRGSSATRGTRASR